MRSGPNATDQASSTTSAVSLCRADSCTYDCAFCRTFSTPSAVISLRTFAGTPATRDRAGICVPSSTTAPAATRDSVPTSASLRSVECIPMSTSSSTTAPWTRAWWRIETRAPMTTGLPASVCITVWSRTVEASAIVHGAAGIGVRHGVVLGVRVLSDRDRCGLGAQDAPVEDPGALLHVDVPDQGGTGGDEGAGIDSGRVPADGHEAGAVEIVGHESSI